MVKKTGIKPDERTVSYIMRGALLVLRKSGTNVPIGPIGLTENAVSYYVCIAVMGALLEISNLTL